MKYIVKVPPTTEQGSYSTIVNDNYRSKHAEALQDYNSSRAHDGLPPITKMPRGTTYTAIYEYVVLGNYGQGWEEVTAESTHAEILKRLHEYRANDPQHAYIWRKHPEK